MSAIMGIQFKSLRSHLSLASCAGAGALQIRHPVNIAHPEYDRKVLILIGFFWPTWSDRGISRVEADQGRVSFRGQSDL